MKKILILLAVIISLSSCDDGDIVLESFDFDEESIQDCEGVDDHFLYKIKDNEILILALPIDTFDAAFVNEATDDTPRVVSINSSNQIIYRLYSEDVTAASICSDLPPATPTVTNEWEANGGTIQIESTAIPDEDDPSIIVAYTHTITFLNVSFSGDGSDSFSFESYNFGDFETTVD